MGKKNRQKIKWKPLNLEETNHELRHQTPEKTETGRHQNSSTLQHSNLYAEVNSHQELPSMNSGPSNQNVHHPPPFYNMIGGWSMPQYPRFYYPTLPTAGYRPLQPLEWFNPRLPSNCQYFYAANSSPHRTSKAHYQNQVPFYWNSVLLNPYATLINQSEENTSNYVYPGHYYGPASYNQTNHVTTTPQQTQQQQQQIQKNTVDQQKPKKKRKRKRKRKLLPLKIESEDQTSSCSTLMEDDSASSETRDTSSTGGDDVVDSQICDLVKVESPNDVYKMEEAVSQNKPMSSENLPSRDQLPRLPLVDDLFAVTLVDDIVARAIEIAIQNQTKNQEPPSDPIIDNQYLSINDESEFYLPDDDDSEDSELQELMENSRNSVSPSQSGFRPLDEEDADDVIDLPKVDDESGERISQNCDEASPSVGRERVNWLDCNGFRENESESPEERELVTEIVFISETSFMDESHRARAAERQMGGFGGDEDENEGFGNGDLYTVEVDGGNVDVGRDSVEGSVENELLDREGVDVGEEGLVNVEIGENGHGGVVDNVGDNVSGSLDVERLNLRNLALDDVNRSNPLAVEVGESSGREVVDNIEIGGIGTVRIPENAERSSITIDLSKASTGKLVFDVDIARGGFRMADSGNKHFQRPADHTETGKISPAHVEVDGTTTGLPARHVAVAEKHLPNVDVDLTNASISSSNVDICKNSVEELMIDIESADKSSTIVDMVENGSRMNAESGNITDSDPKYVDISKTSVGELARSIDIAISNPASVDGGKKEVEITKHSSIVVDVGKYNVGEDMQTIAFGESSPKNVDIAENSAKEFAENLNIAENTPGKVGVDKSSVEEVKQNVEVGEHSAKVDDQHKKLNHNATDFASQADNLIAQHIRVNDNTADNLTNNIENTLPPYSENIDIYHPPIFSIDNPSPITRTESNTSNKFDDDFEDEELSDERYMDVTNHEQFYDPLKYKDYYQICTNVEVPDSPSLDKTSKIPFETSNVQAPPKPPRFKTIPLNDDKNSDLPKDLVNPKAEIIVHEMDDVSECGSEDVDTIGHQYQKGDDEKHIYVNQLSLAAELLRTQQSIPYDKEFKPLLEEGEASNTSNDDVTRLQDTASTSHSNREIYDSYYGSRMIQLQDVTTSQPQKVKEVSDSGVQSEESGDEGDDVTKGKGERPTGRPIGYKVLENKAKPLSAMLKGKGDPLCLCCSVM